MLVVEGPDGAGKTTLINQLVDKYGFIIGERGVADRSKLYTVTRRDTYNALADAVRGDEPAKLWDRLFFSEQVYSPMMGRNCEFGLGEQLYVQGVMAALDCPVIVCLPPWQTVLDNAHKDIQMEGVLDNLRLIYDTYDTEDLGWPNRTLWYDWTGDNINNPSANHTFATYEGVCTAIEGYLINRTEREWDRVA